MPLLQGFDGGTVGGSQAIYAHNLFKYLKVLTKIYGAAAPGVEPETFRFLLHAPTH